MGLKNLLQAALHVRKEKSVSHPSITQLLLPTYITLVFTVACFMSATWAWFTANQSSSAAPITAGCRQLAQVTVTTTTAAQPLAAELASEPAGGTEESRDLFPTDGKVEFTAAANETYSLCVNTEGTAKGFVLLTIQEKADAGGDGSENGTWYVVVDAKDEAAEIKLLLDTLCDVTISASWGGPPQNAVLISEGYVIGSGSQATLREENMAAISEGENTAEGEAGTESEATVAGGSSTEPEAAVAGESSTEQETTAVDENGTKQETTVVDENGTKQETTVVDENSTQQETTVVDENSTQEETTAVDESSTKQETTVAGESSAEQQAQQVENNTEPETTVVAENNTGESDPPVAEEKNTIEPDHPIDEAG